MCKILKTDSKIPIKKITLKWYIVYIHVYCLRHLCGICDKTFLSDI
jgi:hypothetical protein